MSRDGEALRAQPTARQVWALLSVSLVRGDDDKPLYFIAQILRHHRAPAASKRELRHQAEHDNLTGLANRRAFGVQLAPRARARAPLRRRVSRC